MTEDEDNWMAKGQISEPLFQVRPRGRARRQAINARLDSHLTVVRQRADDLPMRAEKQIIVDYRL